MRTIYKYQLKVEDAVSLEMPKGAEILTIQVQNRLPCLWAIVDNSEPEEETRKFWTFGTGHPLDYECTLNNYIGTYQLHNGGLVFHVFEVKN